MSDKQKGVNVKTPQEFDDGIDHPGATRIWVGDGHLHVGRDASHDRETLAVYAPGQWSSATVNR
jgi:hypothetical protein